MRVSCKQTMLQITEKAREMLDKFAEQAEDDDMALKIVILGRGPKGFQYDLQLIGSDDALEDLSLIHICRCRRSTLCRSRWSPYH